VLKKEHQSFQKKSISAHKYSFLSTDNQVGDNAAKVRWEK
jgi:hypothetical protein